MALRRFLILTGVALMVLGGVMIAHGARRSGAAMLLINGGLLAGGIVFEHYKYKDELDREPGAGWVRTDEKTVTADHIVTVWYHPASGERAYVRSRPSTPSRHLRG
jgi:hypothetical protein